MTEIIQVQHLYKRFSDLTAVDGISFSVRAGEFFGILGPNGAGKTTTIRRHSVPRKGQIVDLPWANGRYWRRSFYRPCRVPSILLRNVRARNGNGYHKG